jgi:hypothetical protein
MSRCKQEMAGMARVGIFLYRSKGRSESEKIKDTKAPSSKREFSIGKEVE